MSSLARASAQNRLPQLKLLDISRNRIRYGDGLGCLSNLLSHQFPSMTHLILCKCGLVTLDLDKLAQANLAGKLPSLKYVDVSFNNLTGHLSHLTEDLRTGLHVSWNKIVCVDEFLDGSKLLLSAQNNC